MRQTAPATTLSGGPFLLGEWRVYPERNLLVSDGDSRRVEPKVMDALLALVGRAGEVVSKDELIDAVWEGRIISEGTLSNTLAQLRAALGDDARSPRFVETIPKRGYRLLCPVDALPEDAPDAPEVLSRSRRPWMLWTLALAAAAAVAATAVVVSRPKPLDPRLVLVTPFANLTGDSALEPLASLARDRIVAQLSPSGMATPLPAEEALARRPIGELCEAARRRRAGLAVTGALYLSEGRVEVQTQLVDVSNVATLHAASSISAPGSSAEAAVDEAIARVLGALAIHLHAHAHATLSSHVPSFEASREFLAGSEIFGRDMAGAITHLERAVELDPEFTSAAFRLAVALRAVDRAPEGRQILDRLDARRAELTLTERLWLDGFIADFEGRWADALAIQEAIAREGPEDWVGLLMTSGRQLALDRPRQAIATLERMHALEVAEFVSRHAVYLTSHRRLALAWHMVGDHEAELAAARGGLRRFPTDPELMRSEVKALTVLGDTAALETILAESAATPRRLTHADLLVEAAAAARAHGQPELSANLAGRAATLLGEPHDQTADLSGSWLLAKAQLLQGELTTAQQTLSAIERRLDGARPWLATGVRGYLGVVAARRGDLATAASMDEALDAVDDPYLYGLPLYYRAAIAAWLGHREQAIDLLRAARAAGWSFFNVLHDDDRALFEPLEGLPEYDRLVHPTE